MYITRTCFHDEYDSSLMIHSGKDFKMSGSKYIHAGENPFQQFCGNCVAMSDLVHDLKRLCCLHLGILSMSGKL